MTRLKALSIVLLSSFLPVSPTFAQQCSNSIPEDARVELIAQMSENIVQERSARPRLARIQEQLLRAQVSGDQSRLHALMADYMNEVATLTPFAIELQAQAALWKRSAELQKEIDAARRSGRLQDVRAKEKIQHAILSGLSVPRLAK